MKISASNILFFLFCGLLLIIVSKKPDFSSQKNTILSVRTEETVFSESYWQFADITLLSGAKNIIVWRSPFGDQKNYGAQTTHVAAMMLFTSGTWTFYPEDNRSFMLKQTKADGSSILMSGSIHDEFARSFGVLSLE